VKLRSLHARLVAATLFWTVGILVAVSAVGMFIIEHHPRMALSAYHVPTDPEQIPALVRAAWPNYKMACGPCAEANGRVRPDILYFQ